MTFANTDLINAWSLPKFPTLNVWALFDGHRRNVAAFTKANQAVADGMKTLAQRGRDRVRTTVHDDTKVTSDLLSGTSVQERATKQVDDAGRIYVSGVARLIELSDITMKTNVSVMNILNARVIEGFEELKALFPGRGSPTTLNSREPSIAADEIVVDQFIGNAVAAVPLTTPTSAPRKLRAAKATSTSARAPKAASKTTARAAQPARRRNTRK
jgi:hypothetical protein